MVVSHRFYMYQALKKAWQYQLLTFPNPAVGAVLLSPCGKILSIEAHQKAGCAHAEVLALQEGYVALTKDEAIKPLTNSSDIHAYLLKNHNGCFRGCSLYTTLEPCSHVGKTPSCAVLLSKLELAEVYIGSKDTNAKASGGAAMLLRNNIHVECGILEKECAKLLVPFYEYLKKKRVVFFKWASRLDGSTNGGTISSKTSREMVHKLRDVCDLIVIGGNTVRTDRPTLDARLCGGKSPDVLIYSRQKEFDKDIPLFNVPNRKVFISDNFEKLKEYRLVMIEGSEAMFEATRDITDLYLAFIAPSMKKSDGFRGVEAKLHLLYTEAVQEDILAWYTKAD